MKSDLDDSPARILDPQANAGYGLAPLPNERDDQIARLMGTLGSESRFELFLKGLGTGQDRVLRCFAERAATLAVRRGDPELLRRALLALAAGGLVQGDREALVVLAVLHDASRRVGGDVPKLFDEIAAVAGAGAKGALGRFLARTDADKSLEAMGYRVAEGEPEFRYERTW